MVDGDRKRLVISEDDLAEPAAVPPPPPGAPAPPPPPTGAQPLSPQQQAGTVTASPPPPTQSFPTVEGARGQAHQVTVGAPAGKAGAPVGAVAFARTVQGRNLVAAAAGIALGWAVTQITGFGLTMWTPTSQVGVDATSAAWIAALGLFFAVVYTGWEHILARSWEGVRLVIGRAAPWGLGLGFVSGFVAQAVYSHFVDQIVRSLTPSDTKLYLARALGWGLFGLGMGAAVAGGLKAKEKIVNGLIGGAIGGTLGGFVFQWVGYRIHSNGESRLVGLLVVGTAIGFAIGLVEKVRRDAWMLITGGPMAGKEFILYGAESTLGSSPKCDITLIKDPAIQPFHAIIRTVDRAGGQTRILDPYEGCSVTINGMPVDHHLLRSGDTIGLGAMAISYAERAAV